MIDYYDPHARWTLIPEHMHGGVMRYVMDGAPMGGFLTSLFDGSSFLDVAGRADDDNLRALRGWAMFLYNHVPATCKGSPEVVAAWRASGGINGQMKAREAGQ